jgi:hypothetical protein
MSRIVRRFAALGAIAALVFSQLAVSAFACPHEAAPEAMAQVSMQPSGDGCEEMANRNLCERHCDYGSSLIAYSWAASPALPAAELPWRIEPIAIPHISRVVLERESLHLHSPPSLILLGVLRI